jgi:hypothetical protein
VEARILKFPDCWNHCARVRYSAVLAHFDSLQCLVRLALPALPAQVGLVAQIGIFCRKQFCRDSESGASV